MDLSALVSEAADGTPAVSLTDAELTERLLALTEAIDRLTALRRAVAGAWDHRMVWAGDAARSGTAWLAHNTELSRPRAAAELRVARRLRTMPHLARASETGELGAEKVTALSHAVDRDPDGRLAELFAQHEAQLVRDARTLTVDQTRTAVRYWRSCASDTAATFDARAQHEARSLRLIPAFDGMVDVAGRLDAVAAAILDNRLNQVMECNRRAAQAAPADGESGRTATQRRADALVQLVTAAPATTDDATHPDDSNESARPLPLLVIDVPLETLEGRSGEPATLPDGTPVPFETLSRLACQAGIAAIITRAGRLTVDLGRTSYTPNRGQRRALTRRDRHCIFPGCDAPPAWCDAHHLWPWEKGGPTALWNLSLVCRFHHHLVHEGGFRLLADRSGTIHAYRPDHTEIHAPPGRTPHQIDPRPPGARVPSRWSAPGSGQLPLGATTAGTAPPGGWDPANPPDPDLDDLAYRRWQDHRVHQRVAEVIAQRGPAA